MIDKIIQIGEIVMWTLLTIFVVFVAYIGLSYFASFIDFKPNKIGPVFMYNRKFDTSTFELDESCKDYFTLEIENVDKEILNDEEEKEIVKVSYVKLLPIKETKTNIPVTIYEVYTEDNVPSLVNWHSYTIRNEYVAVNKLVATINEYEYEEEEKEEVLEETVTVNE